MEFDIYESTCLSCGESFGASRNDARIKFCSRRCQAAFNRDRADKQPCSESDCELPVRAKGLCRKHYNAKAPNRSKWKKNGNPEVRRAALRRKTQRRRARLKGDPDAELIDRDDIGHRDGWRCGLCAKTVDRTLPWPHLKSASLDHIVPLSVGGKHVLTNVQIAHFDCNMAKGNRGGGEQLLLVG